MKKNILSFIIIASVILAFWMYNSKSQGVQSCELTINRFEQDFFRINQDLFDQEFTELKNKYPSFFNEPDIDFKKDVYLNDTLNTIFDSVQVVFKDELLNLEQLKEGFCNYKNYFPLDSFTVYTYIEGTFDYRYPVVYADDKLFISLELFLGNNHSFYNSFPEYIKYGYDMNFLATSCYLTLAGRHIPYSQTDTFISSILYYAKAYYFAQQMLPNISDEYFFKCSEDKIRWCQNNEQVIWEYMIENEYLFSTSRDLVDRFIGLAPFSKFGLSIDQQSPGSVGVWLGLQILNAYADNNNVSLLDILNESDYVKILNKSGYKP